MAERKTPRTPSHTPVDPDELKQGLKTQEPARDNEGNKEWVRTESHRPVSVNTPKF